VRALRRVPRTCTPRVITVILVIDNYDSFTFNLVQMLLALDVDVRVVRNDDMGANEIRDSGASHLVVSPGPCSPRESGVSVEAIRAARVPVLGVCLGHQCIAAAFGGTVVRAPTPVHGKATHILHDGSGIFAGMPPAFAAARYHSLVVERESLPEELEVIATNDEGLIMALQHRTRPLVGLQFHPESVLTPDGPRLIRNFLAM